MIAVLKPNDATAARPEAGSRLDRGYRSGASCDGQTKETTCL